MYRRVAVVGRGALAVPRLRCPQRPYSQRPNPDDAPEEEVERPRSRRTINTNLLSTLGAKPVEPPKPAPPPPPPPEVQPEPKQTTTAPRAPPAAAERAAPPQSAKAAAPATRQQQQQQPAQAKNPANAAQPAAASAKVAQPQQTAPAKGPAEKKLIDTLANAQKASQPTRKQAPKAAPAAAQQTNTARVSQKPDAKAAPAPKQQQRQSAGAKVWTPQQAKTQQEKGAQPKSAPAKSKPAAEQPSLATRLRQAAEIVKEQAQAQKAAAPPAQVEAKTPAAPTQKTAKPEVVAKPAPSAEPVAADATPVSDEASAVKAGEGDAQPTEAAARPDDYQPIGPTTKMPEESTASSEPRGKSPRQIFEEYMKTYSGPKVLVEDLQVQEPDTRIPLVELELDHLAQSVRQDVINAGWSPTLAHLQPAVIRKIALRIAQREGKTKALPKYTKRMSGFMHMAGAAHAPRYPNDRVKPQRSAEGAREKLWRAQVRRPDGWRLRAETVAAIALPPDRVRLRHQGELESDMLGYLRMRRNRKEWRAEVAGGDYKRFLAHAPVPDVLDAGSAQGQAQLAVRSAFLALQRNTTISLKKKRAAREAYRELVKGEKGAAKVRLPPMTDAPSKINIEAVVDIVAPLTALELPEYADQFTEETHPSRLR